MNILFYSPFDQRSRDVESLILAFRDQGHHVISLSQGTGAQIHEYLEAQGVETATRVLPMKSMMVYYFRHILFLIRFCKQREVDIVYSHLEPCNFVASIAQFFISARVFICRHHIDEAALQGFDRSLVYRLTYRLAKTIVVVSNHSARYMEEVEKISRRKIVKINLAYDFKLYPKPNQDEVSRIKRVSNAEVTLLTIGRFTKYKRVDLSIGVLRRLLQQGIDAKLIILGRGEGENKLHQMISEHGLKEKVIMPGYVPNVTDYLAASDFLIHPSVLESSCVAVKEAAINNVPVIVCENVGDFDDYIVNGENGFVVRRDFFEEETTTIIQCHYKDEVYLKTLTDKLKRCVSELFSIKNIVSQYDRLNAR